MQYCGLYYHSSGNLTKGNEVGCQNPGKHCYNCPAELCSTAQGAIDAQLYFLNCESRWSSSEVKFPYVWPTEYKGFPSSKEVAVSFGTWSDRLNGTRYAMNSSAWCTYQNGYQRNNIRVRCKDRSSPKPNRPRPLLNQYHQLAHDLRLQDKRALLLSLPASLHSFVSFATSTHLLLSFYFYAYYSLFPIVNLFFHFTLVVVRPFLLRVLCTQLTNSYILLSITVFNPLGMIFLRSLVCGLTITEMQTLDYCVRSTQCRATSDVEFGTNWQIDLFSRSWGIALACMIQLWK
ncbi:hypothetical protein O181_053026 [Austropuccinia psidii MF-1]|uniref:Uncharacterized protein n=1 Tax=Austropuccinia psidii MF-1 TaxID=1389203 RepID=A0A9Q3HPT5_9BASI|nr:hypothetical protein [Austropuccinia psidii MF-1]